MFNKDEIKNTLTIDQIFQLVAELGGEPRMEKSGSIFVAQTICHNHPGEGSHKLYYYDNTKLFKCYTDCYSTFDVFELIIKIKSRDAERAWSLPEAMKFIAQFFNLSIQTDDFSNLQSSLQDWKVFNRYDKIDSINNSAEQKVELKLFDESILQYLPRPRILPWEEEGISAEVMEARGICYNPCTQGIIIPHYDIDGQLIGIRERTLIEENETYGKYRPAIFNGKMYNHPLGFNLYNLNFSKENIKTIKKAIIWEGEKSCLLYASYFGIENDISCAACGSSLINHQVKLLLSLGVEEIIIGFDKQFKEIGDEEWKRWTKKLTDIHTRYGANCQISYLFDKGNLLDYKDSPIDKGPDVFMQLFKERIML